MANLNSHFVFRDAFVFFFFFGGVRVRVSLLSFSLFLFVMLLPLASFVVSPPRHPSAPLYPPTAGSVAPKVSVTAPEGPKVF